MSDSRVPEIPLPRPFLRVIHETPVTKDDVEKVRRTLQESIDILQAELRREKELTKKLAKSGEVLQDILSAPDFKALSLQSREAATVTGPAAGQTIHTDEPPVEYVEVTEIELTDAEVHSLESGPVKKKESE